MDSFRGSKVVEHLRAIGVEVFICFFGWQLMIIFICLNQPVIDFFWSNKHQITGKCSSSNPRAESVVIGRVVLSDQQSKVFNQMLCKTEENQLLPTFKNLESSNVLAFLLDKLVELTIRRTADLLSLKD